MRPGPRLMPASEAAASRAQAAFHQAAAVQAAVKPCQVGGTRRSNHAKNLRLFYPAACCCTIPAALRLRQRLRKGAPRTAICREGSHLQRQCHSRHDQGAGDCQPALGSPMKQSRADVRAARSGFGSTRNGPWSSSLMRGSEGPASRSGLSGPALWCSEPYTSMGTGALLLSKSPPQDAHCRMAVFFPYPLSLTSRHPVCVVNLKVYIV